MCWPAPSWWEPINARVKTIELFLIVPISGGKRKPLRLSASLPERASPVSKTGPLIRPGSIPPCNRGFFLKEGSPRSRPGIPDAVSCTIPRNSYEAPLMESMHGTTVLAVRRNGRVVIGGDGQVTVSYTHLDVYKRQP